ncbi:hypothetical protein ONE63_011315 [Megalurothrips usitatus]|uniref:Uncharacterized protein n=1 Tax=Megalurothrips usitatus TaxID=439358 RepID=A0AAV7WZM4_9NEOP|nr:hypothetical protein ONE63_011315 [Megalurothrips usitatus]
MKRVVPTVTKSQPKLSEAEKLSKLKEKIIEERKKAMSIQEHEREVGKIALPTGDSKRISDEDIIPCDDWMEDESEVTKDISFYSGSPNSPSHNGSRALDCDAGEEGNECDSRVHSSLTVEDRMSSKSSPLRRKATESKSPRKQKNTANLKSPKKRSSSASSSSENRQEELLLEISNKMDIMLMNQFKANKALMPHEKRIQRPPNLPPPPLREMTELKSFEKFLDDDSNLSAASYYFSSFSLPKTEKDAMFKLMPKLMTDHLAEKFYFNGKGDKSAFESTKLWQAVQGALSLKYEGDLSEALKDLRGWLRNAKGRIISTQRSAESSSKRGTHQE